MATEMEAVTAGIPMGVPDNQVSSHRRGGEKMSVGMGIALFIAGMAAGIALHRLIMTIVLDHSPDTVCSHCRWMYMTGGKKSRHKK